MASWSLLFFVVDRSDLKNKLSKRKVTNIR